MFKKIVRGEGFTLIELLAVMAIVAVLAGIIAVAVSGSGETSRDTQTVQDGTSIETSAADFFSNATGGELLETKTGDILGYTITTTGAEETSSQWPEDFLTDTYSTEFPTTTATVDSVTLTEEDDTTTDFTDLLDGYTAISFTDLEDGNFLTTTPDSVEAVSTSTLAVSGASTSFDFHNFLWLFEADTTSGSTGTVGSRNVAIYKLTTVEKDPNGTDTDNDETVALSYLRIF